MWNRMSLRGEQVVVLVRDGWSPLVVEGPRMGAVRTLATPTVVHLRLTKRIVVAVRWKLRPEAIDQAKVFEALQHTVAAVGRRLVQDDPLTQSARVWAS